MTTIPQIEPNYISDILVWLPDNRYSYHIVTAKIKNTTGAERTLSEVIGMPVNESAGDYLLVLNAGVANIDGIVVGVTDGAPNNPTIASAGYSDYYYFILVRGPAQIVEEKIAVNDPAGTPYTMASVVTALAAKNILMMHTPEETTIQST